MAHEHGDGYIRHHVYLDVLADYLWIAEDADGELYFPVRPTCAALELDSPTHIAIIKADSRLAPGLLRIKLPSPGGEQTQQCLRREEYGWWLMLVDPKRFKAERRASLERRQRVLMHLAGDIIAKRDELAALPVSSRSASVNVVGQLEAPFQCLECGAKHLIVIDGAGWRIHLAVRTE